jgi:hypothetical protein
VFRVCRVFLCVRHVSSRAEKCTSVSPCRQHQARPPRAQDHTRTSLIHSSLTTSRVVCICDGCFSLGLTSWVCQNEAQTVVLGWGALGPVSIVTRRDKGNSVVTRYCGVCDCLRLSSQESVQKVRLFNWNSGFMPTRRVLNVASRLTETLNVVPCMGLEPHGTYLCGRAR